MPESPVYPSAILGYRMWTLDGTQLRSLIRPDGGWQSAVEVAGCYKLPATDSPSHKAPDPGCECGLYAYYTPQQWDRWEIRGMWEQVVGAVAGAGEVHLHPDGFRAERMQILGFLGPEQFPSHAYAHQLTRRYGVPFYGSVEELHNECSRWASPWRAWDPS